MKYWLSIILAVFIRHVCAQEVLLCRTDPERKGVVNLKWYAQPLLSTEGFRLYRRSEMEREWKRLNDRPISFADYRPVQADLNADDELGRYLQLAAEPRNIKDLVLLAVLVKSFSSAAFSRYLGIAYDDENCTEGTQYEYRLMRIVKGKEIEVASVALKAGLYAPIAAPREIVYSKKKQSLRFACLPEPARYYGIHVYRQTGDSSAFVKLTSKPLMLTEQKAANSDTLNKVFFEDRDLKEKVRYTYYFEAVDFFGAASERSAPLTVIFPDQTAPTAPQAPELKVEGKKVSLKWKYRSDDPDLAGFHIYRTNKNDTDFTRVSSVLLHQNDSVYTDVTGKFSSYLYKLSALDKDGNESFSNPAFIEVFDNEPPAKPAGLRITGDTGAILLRWNRNPESDIAGYFVYRTINSDRDEAYVKLSSQPLRDTLFTDSLDKKTKNNFYYRVIAVDQSMNRSAYSDAVFARMPDVTPPSPPFLRTISLSSWKYPQLEWFPNPEPDLFAYNVFRRSVQDSIQEFQKINPKAIPAGIERFTDRNALPGSSYEYRLQALDSTLNVSAPSNLIPFRLRKEINAITISEFKASYNKRKKRVDLSWKTEESAELKGFIVYRKSGGYFEPLCRMTRESICYDGAIAENTEYTYELRAYHNEGEVSRAAKVLRIPPQKRRSTN